MDKREIRGLSEKLETDGTGDTVWEIPSLGIPLHPVSAEKLLKIAETEKKIIVFRPDLPVTSELGLPPYPVLAYLYPRQLEPIWQRIQEKIDTTLLENDRVSQPFILISQIDIEEQLYYFGEYYATAMAPNYVRAIVSNTCNLKCVMCPYHSSLLKPSHTTDFFNEKKVMSWEMMERLAEDCGKDRIPLLIGSVEEPLLHPRLVDFIRLCRQLGVPRVHLTTNGQLLDKTRSRALLEAGLTSIDISLDAVTPETYRQIRGSDLARVESNIMNFLRLRDRLQTPCEIRTSFVRNHQVTLEEERAFLQRWLPEVNSVFVLNVAEYQDKNIHLGNHNKAVQKSLEYYRQKAEGRWACLFPFIEMSVLPDGRIYYCIETLFRLGFDREVESLGNYHEQNLREIWQGKLFNQLRQDLILNQFERKSACKSCTMWMSQVVDRDIEDDCQTITTTVTEIYSKKSRVRSTTQN